MVSGPECKYRNEETADCEISRRYVKIRDLSVQKNIG